MSKILSLVLGAAVLASASDRFVQQVDPVDPTPDGLNATEMRYYFTVIRGTLEGFQIGLYNDKKFVLNAKCMDEDTLKMVIKIEDLWSS